MLIHLLDPTNPPVKRLARCGTQFGLMTESQGTVPNGSPPGTQSPVTVSGVGDDGNVHRLHTTNSGDVYVTAPPGGMQVEGTVAEGVAPGAQNPVTVSGVGDDGRVHRLHTTDSGDLDVIAAQPEAGPWIVSRTLTAQEQEQGPPVATSVRGVADLTGYVYPGGFDGTSITINGTTLTFAAGDPVSEVALLGALSAAFPGITFDIDTDGGRFLRLTYAGNLILSGSLLAPAGIAAATYGSWTDLGLQAPVVEISYEGLVATGAPDSITLRTWRQVGDVVDCIGEVALDQSDLAATPAHRFSCDARAVQVTVEFAGGMLPALSGAIIARAVFDGAVPSEPMSGQDLAQRVRLGNIARSLGMASNPSSGEIRVVLGTGAASTLAAVTTVTTVSAVTNLANVGGIEAKQSLLYGVDRQVWLLAVRARIT